jgi:hypothetical protein
VITVNLKKALIAIIGSICCYLLIDSFIVSLKIWQYLLIETVITLSHFLYEEIKKRGELE